MRLNGAENDWKFSAYSRVKLPRVSSAYNNIDTTLLIVRIWALTMDKRVFKKDNKC